AHGSVPIHDDEDDSPVEEVPPVKPKKPSRRATRAKNDDPKEPLKDWTVAEETVLCQAWCDVSKNNIDGNSMKAKGFWEAVIRYFENETGSSRGYDSIFIKWKNRVHPRIDVFCVIINNVEANHESGTNDLDVYQKACAEYKMIYKTDFTLEHCYNILKDHPGWKDVEMPSFYKSQGRKKSKTFETTLGSTSGGLNLNEETDEDVEETQEFRQMTDKSFNMKQKKWGKKDEQQQSYIEFKNRELSNWEAKAREIAQLKREKLEIQRRTLELAEKKKRDRDILFYNSLIDPTLPPIQQQKLLEMKMKIKERYNLDY
ncbi:retrotransposon protein, putative, ty3-gypsy subclass, partial [Tanacetum coccineum]